MYWSFLFVITNLITVLSSRRNICRKISNVFKNPNLNEKPKFLYFGHEKNINAAIKNLANYEVGRAMIMAYFKEMYTVNKVTLNPNEKINTLYKGYVDYDELFSKTNITNEILKKQMIVKMAGQAALTIYNGKKTDSLEMTNDFKEAKEIARVMFTNNYDENNADSFLNLYSSGYSENVRLIDKDDRKYSEKIIKSIVNNALFEAMQILLFRKDKMDLLSNELTKNKEINKDFLYIYMENDFNKSDMDREY